MPTATVTLNVTTFPTLGGQCVISRPVIVDNANNRLLYAGDETNFGLIAVGKAGDPLDIAFTIPGYTANNVTFTPVGGGLGADFPNQSRNGSTVTVTDVFADVGKGETMPQWEYAITIVNARGTIGLIDPEIENQVEN